MDSQLKPRDWTFWVGRAVGALIVGVFCALVLWGLGWGVPSRERARLEGAAGHAPKLPPEILEESWRHWGSRGRQSRLAAGFQRYLFNPIRSYHPDEYLILKSLSNMDPRRLNFNPGNYIYPSLHTYLVGGAIGACAALRMVRVERGLDHYFEHPEAMARMYLVGRALSLLAALGALLLVWRVGERMQRGAGLLAMGLLAAMPALGIHAHNMTRDTFAALAAVVFFACCRRLAATGSGKSYDLAGAAAGLCVGFQYFAVVLWGLVPVAAALRARARRGTKDGGRGTGDGSVASHAPRPTSHSDSGPSTPSARPEAEGGVARRLANSFLVMVAIFCLVCPYHVLNARQFIADFRSETGHVGEGSALLRLASLGWATHWLRMMPPMVTWPLTVVVCAGVVLALVRRRDDDVLLLVWLAVWAGVVGFDGRAYSRYYVPLLPAFALLAARGLVWAWEASRRLVRWRLPRLGVAVVALAVVAGPAAGMTWAWSRLYSRENVRTLAGEWIAANLPDGARIGMTKWPWQFEMPPLDAGRYRFVVLEDSPRRLAEDLDRLWQLSPEYFVASSIQSGPIVLPEHATGPEDRFWEFLVSSGVLYQMSHEPFRVPLLDVFGREIDRTGWPEDMGYVNPVIYVLERRISEAKARGAEGGT